MARAHEPPNGSDHPPQNGTKGKQVAIALFIATTFGIMVILSFPLSQVARLPLKLPRPLQAALTPAERLIRPIIPWLGNPFGSRPPKLPVANPPTAPGVSPSVPLGPTSPGGPGTEPPAPPPPGGQESPTLPRTLTKPGQQIPPTLVRELTTLLSTLSKKLSPEEARLVRAEIARLRPMRAACLADRACAKQLKRLEKLLRKYEARQRGRHGGKHRHAHGNESTEGSSRSSAATSDGGRQGQRTHGKHKKHSKHHKSLVNRHKKHSRLKG